MTHFDFVLYHKLEKIIQAEDPLSRQVDHEMETDLNYHKLHLDYSSVNT